MVNLLLPNNCNVNFVASQPLRFLSRLVCVAITTKTFADIVI